MTASTYGIAAALTLDEFALWLDLHDDYWDAKGRKSVDAAIIFGGILSSFVVASQAFEELGWAPRLTQVAAKLDIRRQVSTPGASDGDAVPAGGSVNGSREPSATT